MKPFLPKRFLPADFALLGFLALQILFWEQTGKIIPHIDVVPPVPSKLEVEALSFGDKQFYFRVLSFELQNMGDSWGRFTALKLYDYKKLSQWLYLLDGLDPLSNFLPSIASYYYSQTQNTPDIRYMVDFLETHAMRNPGKKWWWLAQAVYLSNHKLGDKKRAIEIAQKLNKAPGDEVLIWGRQMLAFLLADSGEKEAARKIICEVARNYKSIPQGEVNFMAYFLEDRLKMFKRENKNKEVSLQELCH